MDTPYPFLGWEQQSSESQARNLGCLPEVPTGNLPRAGVGSGWSSWEGGWYSLVHVALGAGREVCLHDCLELCLVAAVFEDRVVMVTAQDEGLVV